MKKLLILYLLLLCSGSVMAEKEQTTFMCIPEVAAGLVFDKNKKNYVGAELSSVEKYIVKFEEDFSTVTVTLFGSDTSLTYTCVYHRCNDFFGQFVFEPSTLRFMRTHLEGYTNYSDKNHKFHIPDSVPSQIPFIEGGKCSPL